MIVKAVSFAFKDNQLGRHARGRKQIMHQAALLKRDQGVSVAVHKQKRRVAFGDMGHRADQSSQVLFFRDASAEQLNLRILTGGKLTSSNGGLPPRKQQRF